METIEIGGKTYNKQHVMDAIDEYGIQPLKIFKAGQIVRLTNWREDFEFDRLVIKDSDGNLQAIDKRGYSMSIQHGESWQHLYNIIGECSNFEVTK